MDTPHKVIIGLLTVLILLVVARSSRAKSGFTPRSPDLPLYPGGNVNPRTMLNKQLSALRGARNDGYNQPPFWRQPHGLDRYHRSGASVKPEQISAAERESWFAMGPRRAGGSFNTELMYAPETDTTQYHTTEPAIDYGSYVTNLVVDPRTQDNHRKWVHEMIPWSGTAMMVDDMDEAMEATTDFHGLRRPQSVIQYNPWQLTERDTHTFISNNKFNFRG